jgi:hypothetical protein
MNDIFQLEHKDELNAMNKSYEKPESTEKEPDESESYHYSSKTTSYSDGNGLTRTERKVYDSTHRAKIIGTRKIGDKSIIRDREIDYQGKNKGKNKGKIKGKNKEKEIRYNIEDDENEAFKEEWKNRGGECFEICFSGERTESVSETFQIQR